MKTLISKLWIWLIILIIISILIFFLLNKEKSVGSPGISQEEFDKITIGMSQTAVSNIIDPTDEWNNDDVYKKCCEKIEEYKENHKYKYVYKYYGENGGYALITYEADYSDGSLFKLPAVVKKEKVNL